MKKENKKSYEAENVAKYFIYLASREVVGDNKEREGITNLKLQKILFFAQAYFVAKLDKLLFKDALEAWTYGPVVPSIYSKYKKHKSDPIIIDKDRSTLKDEDKEQLKRVWEVFGGFSAGRLVDIVHSHKPWKEAYNSDNIVITIKAIREYYATLLNK